MTKYTPLDPLVFKPEAVDSKTAAVNKRIEAILSRLPQTHTMTPGEVRAQRASGESWIGPMKQRKDGLDRRIKGPDHDIPLRIFVPEETLGVYLHLHGGGFVIGHANEFDDALFETSKRSRVAVVNVDYRLAPEHPHPAAAADCEAAALWVAENALQEFGSDRLIIGGESAGANLSVVTLARMRDRHGFTGFSAANLVYGCYDISMTPSQRNWGERNLVISTPTIEWFNTHYVPEVERRRDPDVSPLYADLSHFPRALFTVGTLDPLLDDSLFMYARWAAAGNAAELAVYPGGTHIFNYFPTPIAKEANARIFDFIARDREE